MPEGDTVWRQCRVLDENLAGSVITRAELRVPQYATVDLRGWTVANVTPRGKHLLMRLQPPAGSQAAPLTLHHHLMMDGVWQVGGTFFRSSDTVPMRRPLHTARIVLEIRKEQGAAADRVGSPDSEVPHPPAANSRASKNGDSTVKAIAFDVKQIRLLRTTAESEVVGHLGPDLLDPQWNDELRARAIENLQRIPDRPIGNAILDQRNLAGIGNVYRSELCFLQRIHPAAPVKQCTTLEDLVDQARTLLMLNRDRVVRVTTGGMLGRGGDLWVYGRYGKRCRRCRARLERGELADPSIEGTEGRVITTCPRCQGPAPA